MAVQLGISAQYLGLMEWEEQPVSQPVALNRRSCSGSALSGYYMKKDREE